MRELKFRAWEKEDKEMCDVEELIFADGELIKASILYKNGNDVLRYTSMIELMQFTGLKDKNGEFIYEGDLLKGDAYVDDIFEVIWEGNHYGVGFSCFGKDGAMVDMEDDWSDLEIVGNIYQNPELLKV